MKMDFHRFYIKWNFGMSSFFRYALRIFFKQESPSYNFIVFANFRTFQLSAYKLSRPLS